MPFQDFDAARAEFKRESDPITFQLGGETFTCIERVPLADAFEIMDAPDYDLETQSGSFIRVNVSFIKKTLIEGDVARFDALLANRDDVIEAETILAVVNWIGERYAGRPLEESADSSKPSPSTSPRSKRAKSKAAANGSRNSP